MPYYSVSRQVEPDGEHLVHARGCERYPNELDAQPLGWHIYCSLALAEAARFFPQVNGCRRCCPPCHRGR